MHYTGMLAMRMDALIRYDAIWFGASVVVAVVLATLAIWMMFFTIEAREFRQGRSPALDGRGDGAGCHADALHGQWARRISCGPVSRPRSSPKGSRWDSLVGAVIIGAVAFTILTLAWVSATLDERKSAEA